MHNGNIADFNRIKRVLQQSLKEEFFLAVQGNTDSEWAFAVFLNFLEGDARDSLGPEILRTAMLKTIAQLNQWAKEKGVLEVSLSLSLTHCNPTDTADSCHFSTLQ